jgi:hypothetical protein
MHPRLKGLQSLLLRWHPNRFPLGIPPISAQALRPAPSRGPQLDSNLGAPSELQLERALAKCPALRQKLSPREFLDSEKAREFPLEYLVRLAELCPGWLR